MDEHRDYRARQAASRAALQAKHEGAARRQAEALLADARKKRAEEIDPKRIAVWDAEIARLTAVLEA